MAWCQITLASGRYFSAVVLACCLGILSPTSDAAAQTAVCSDTPSNEERVKCTEDETSSDDIDILLEGVDIDVVSTALSTHGVHAEHKGTGSIDIEVTGTLDESDQVVRSTIDTSGEIQAYAIYGQHDGTGTIDISVSDTTINTTGRTGQAIHSRHYGTGRILIDVTNTRIHMTGKDASGIYARHHNTSTTEGADANVSIEALMNEITTEGQSAYGIWSVSEGLGDATVTSTSNTITTKGRYARGIYGYHLGEGDILITSLRDTIVTENDLGTGTNSIADGILAWHQRGNGDIIIRVIGSSIRTTGTFSPGIRGIHTPTGYTPGDTQGDVNIDVRDAVIETTGSLSSGIHGRHTAAGAVRIVTRGSLRIATTGEEAHGIEAYHAGTGEDRSIEITVGGTIDVQGEGSDGVRVGRVLSGNADRVAAFDGDGYRRQIVTLNCHLPFKYVPIVTV